MKGSNPRLIYICVVCLCLRQDHMLQLRTHVLWHPPLKGQEPQNIKLIFKMQLGEYIPRKEKSINLYITKCLLFYFQKDVIDNLLVPETVLYRALLKYNILKTPLVVHMHFSNDSLCGGTREAYPWAADWIQYAHDSGSISKRQIQRCWKVYNDYQNYSKDYQIFY